MQGLRDFTEGVKQIVPKDLHSHVGVRRGHSTRYVTELGMGTQQGLEGREEGVEIGS